MTQAMAAEGLRTARPLDPETFGAKDDLLKPHVHTKVSKKIKKRRYR